MREGDGVDTAKMNHNYFSIKLASTSVENEFYNFSDNLFQRSQAFGETDKVGGMLDDLEALRELSLLNIPHQVIVDDVFHGMIFSKSYGGVDGQYNNNSDWETPL